MTHQTVFRRGAFCALVIAASLMLAAAIPAQAEAARPAYTNVYEPDTAVPLAATVCWIADGSAGKVAGRDIRPASALVCLDASLRVLTETGEEIAPHLGEYLKQTAPFIIPVLYLKDAETADALAAWLTEGGQKDVFAAAGYRDAELIKGLAALPHMRGLVDFTGFEVTGEDTLGEMIRITNGSGAKVALLPEELAGYENIRFLQGRLMSVWVRAGEGQASLLRLLARGVNGLVVADYPAAFEVLGFFDGDVPALLRVPFVAGHRGMPSEYVENTLPGALAAAAAGADVIECDIYLSRNGELYINHDLSLNRLFDRGDIGDSERLTLTELQGIPFSFSGYNGVPNANNQPANKSRFGDIKGDGSYRIPALRDYFAAFKGTDIVHFVEIKSHNAGIVAKLKALCEEMGTVGQVAVITFNMEILEAMQREWPEMPVGALGTEGVNLGDGQPGFLDYRSLMMNDGAGEALERLFNVLEPFNATYHPKSNFTYDMAAFGRHRGLTVWPWTYNDPSAFAGAYLKGVYGLTTNFAWWASGLVTRVTAEGARLKVGEAVPPPVFHTQKGETVQPERLTLLTLSGDAVADNAAMKPGEAVLIWRARRSLIIDGKAYGEYDMYSEPFKVVVE
jgi:glycerophosphoryl diester phosphodiesterase